MAKFFGCSINAFFTDVEDCDPEHAARDISKIKATMDIEEKINSALRHFKLNAEVKKIHHGVRILTFIVEMNEGVGISDIKKREKDIIHQIAEENVTFNTVDYKNNTFAIEIPKKDFKGVSLAMAMKSNEYINSDHTLPIIIGYDRNDNLIVDDLTKLPHMLIGGFTGTGKTAFLRNIITCLTSRFSADELKLLICDPKMCEYDYAKAYPHTNGNILTSGQDIVEATRQLIETMNSRLSKFTEFGVRNIKDYNKKSEDKMPYVVMIIDEFADLMLLNRDIEVLVMRIAQKARAAGIHMLIATQRPSVNVFTSVLKANIPSRACLNVLTSVDSKVVLDEAGAENLSIHGDMLYTSILKGNSPIRLQVPYISEDEAIDIIKRR
jgi:S-DNA-T family DNA segregation ATPase FtsK/SpoIIIE